MALAKLGVAPRKYRLTRYGGFKIVVTGGALRNSEIAPPPFTPLPVSVNSCRKLQFLIFAKLLVFLYLREASTSGLDRERPANVLSEFSELISFTTMDHGNARSYL